MPDCPKVYAKSPFTEFVRGRGRSLRWLAATSGVGYGRLQLYAGGYVHGLRGGEVEALALVLGVSVGDLPTPEWRMGRNRRRGAA